MAAYGDALVMQVRRHGHAVNTETCGEFVDRRPGQVSVDERRNLMVREPGRGSATDTDSARGSVSGRYR